MDTKKCILQVFFSTKGASPHQTLDSRSFPGSWRSQAIPSKKCYRAHKKPIKGEIPPQKPMKKGGRFMFPSNSCHRPYLEIHGKKLFFCFQRTYPFASFKCRKISFIKSSPPPGASWGSRFMVRLDLLESFDPAFTLAYDAYVEIMCVYFWNL